MQSPVSVHRCVCQGVFAVLKGECLVSRAHRWIPAPPSPPYDVGFGNHADEGIKVPVVLLLVKYLCFITENSWLKELVSEVLLDPNFSSQRPSVST